MKYINSLIQLFGTVFMPLYDYYRSSNTNIMNNTPTNSVSCMVYVAKLMWFRLMDSPWLRQPKKSSSLIKVAFNSTAVNHQVVDGTFCSSLVKAMKTSSSGSGVIIQFSYTTSEKGSALHPKLFSSLSFWKEFEKEFVFLGKALKQGLLFKKGRSRTPS